MSSRRILTLRARGSSLDAAITRAARSWRRDNRVWSSEEVCALWDRPLDASVLRPLRTSYAGRVAFPRTAPILERLGVRRGQGGVELEDAELSPLRDAIMAAPSSD